MEYTALGHMVNLASRLCDAAEAGEILTMAETVEKAAFPTRGPDTTHGALPFAAEPKGEYSFKNVPAPVEVFSISEKGGT
jgi:class 3 adenylate cyclase